jgi:hypothetical protein
MTQSVIDAILEVDFAGKKVWPQVSLTLPSRWTQIKKGLRAWLSVWGVAALCLPVPIIHLIFPPLGLLAGPVLGLLVMRKSRRLIERIEGEFVCPLCQARTELHLSGFQLPTYEACPHCKAGFAIYSWQPVKNKEAKV